MKWSAEVLGASSGAKHDTVFSKSRSQGSSSLSPLVSQPRGPRVPWPLALATTPHRRPGMERCDGADVSQAILRDLEARGPFESSYQRTSPSLASSAEFDSNAPLPLTSTPPPMRRISGGLDG